MQATFLWSLRRDPDFFSRAQRIVNQAFILYWEPDELLSPAVVVIVPKTVASLSVTRHKLKRQLKALCRQQSLPRGKWVLVTRRGTHAYSFSQLSHSLTKLLQRVSV